jgi:hypothetical protein
LPYGVRIELQYYMKAPVCTRRTHESEIRKEVKESGHRLWV